MLWWKHVLTKKLWKFRISFRQWSAADVRKRKLSEGRIFPKAEFVRILSEYLPNVPKCGLNTRHDNREVTLSANFALWQMRHRFNPHKRVNDYQRYSMLTVLRSGLCFVPSPIHLRSKLQATIILAGITIYWSLWKIYFEKYFLYLMITNVMMKTCLNQKIMKISNFIQAVKCSVCPKAKVIRRPNFSESRICPNIYRMYRSVDWTHDMTIVKWHLAQTLRSDKCATGSIHTNGSMTINLIPC